ncbi:unnamed protein product [Nippostrongylus brasiliensis]|uniref:Anoctamin n=1 Tax=Nippostrongylus brasiliensis TaxID=27835 RepID=A0A0N4XMV7_NIPBR|nr:unnamed protein product [Nippostrongylus brasiliensis]
MFSILITAVQDHISKPAVWATCINSGINLFVYLILDRELRQHVKSLWTRDKGDSIEMDEEEEEDMLLKKQSMDRRKLRDHQQSRDVLRSGKGTRFGDLRVITKNYPH